MGDLPIMRGAGFSLLTPMSVTAFACLQGLSAEPVFGGVPLLFNQAKDECHG